MCSSDLRRGPCRRRRVQEPSETPRRCQPLRQDDQGCRASRRRRRSNGGASGVDLAFETKTSAVSPRHASPEQADDASTLARSLQDIALVPETTTQSVPDVTMSLLVDRKVPTDSHRTSFRLSLNPPSDLALAGALVEASSNPLGFRMRSPWDRLTDVSTYGPSGSEEDDDPSIGQICLLNGYGINGDETS